ncbi:type II toxin-antitoxin system RelE/ParE family toxin [candidate division FCPU426 bacterium]|nr:type II toxin-antitoxin system RelE/ParE family toxin [candidate division FCPU426 bacterium]
MSYTILYHQDIPKKDLPKIPNNIQKRIKYAIETRLLFDPERYGAPLKRGLQGYRKLRVGDYRIIYKVNNNEIIILKIGHRKDVYEKTGKRI